ncbi:hypothetical protein J437_LFUL019234 [Ladona fulva]|uniref:Uncharacterized protein n=1 Tax=Ladona fulva TaxID=123851 RepID=A0A8K0KRB9_LADFU|nr:hypothetical protein J437_LFUL019234 [Ladona fulva]
MYKCFSEPEPLKASDVKETCSDHSDSSQTSGTKSENEKIIGPTLTAEERRKMFKERTLSESSVESNPAKQAVKGILKRKGRAGLGRSLSESSGGEEYGWMAPLLSQSSSVGSSPSLSDINRLTLGESLKEEEEEYDEEEDDDEEDGEKVKKIVRFSDVISQKTYRSNSSILGQRKKNQRKLRNKKRAAERRASESENSVDEGDTGTDKSDCNSDSSPPDKAEITVQQEQSSAKGKSKASAKKKGNGNKGKGKRVDPKASNPEGATSSQHLEMKSDLIFQLEL